jgi:hypothetical protein
VKVFTLKGDHQLAWINPAGDAEGARLFRARGTAAAVGWQPLRLVLAPILGEAEAHDPPVLTDCPYLGAAQLLLSVRARDALAPLLAPEGEFLAAETDFGAYWIYNPLRSLDALDEERSVIERFPDGGIRHITRHALRPEIIGEHAAFHLRGKTGQCYATDSLANAVAQAGLAGFVFTEIWSSEAGSIDRPPSPLLHRGADDAALRERRIARRAAARDRMAAI